MVVITCTSTHSSQAIRKKTPSKMMLPNLFSSDDERTSITDEAKVRAQQQLLQQKSKLQSKRSDEQIVAEMSDESFKVLRQKMCDSKVITSIGVRQVTQHYIEEKKRTIYQQLAEETRASVNTNDGPIINDSGIGGKLRAFTDDIVAFVGNTASAAPETATSVTTTNKVQTSGDMRQNALQTEPPAEPSNTERRRRPVRRLSKDVQDTLVGFMNDLRKENSEPSFDCNEEEDKDKIDDDAEKNHNSYSDSMSLRSIRRQDMYGKNHQKKQQVKEVSEYKPMKMLRCGRSIGTMFLDGLRDEEQHVDAATVVSRTKLMETLGKSVSVAHVTKDQDDPQYGENNRAIELTELAIKDGGEITDSNKRFIQGLNYMYCEDDGDGSLNTVDAEQNTYTMRAA